MDIHIIGSIDNEVRYQPEQIAGLLETSGQMLAYGTQFMGRPSTRIYSGEHDIVKLRTEIKLNLVKTNEWVTYVLEQERKLGVHHPQKTWFICKFSSLECIAGNICPRLTPLHLLFNSDTDNSEYIALLDKLYQAYFKVASVHSKRLDDGMSNFGLDLEGKLYYLDDDVYSWDNFLGFAQSLGILVRSNPWLDENGADQLAESLYGTVADAFPGREAHSVIAGKLRDIFIPDRSRQGVLDKLIHRFQNNKVISKTRRFQDRYWAIFADVHANLPALQTVLAFLKDENIKQGIVLGDTIGYGPHPLECIERLQESGFDVLKGNHDHAAISGNARRGMSSTASWCIDWTIPLLSNEHRRWLERLPLEFTGMADSAHTWIAMHGSPLDPQYFYGYVYEMTYEDNLNALEQRNFHWCFHGHAHVQGIYARKKNLPDAFYKTKTQDLEQYRRCLICPGSVGQPRDGEQGAQLAILDQKEQKISFRTLPYSLDQTIADLKKHSFPENLIKRLEKGY